jgi:hypothetical protein
MKIRKPWRSRKEILDLEEQIVRMSRNIEGHFFDLSYNMGIYSSSYLFNRRINLNCKLAEIRGLAEDLRSCYFFNSQFHPDYEATQLKVHSITNYIGEEIVRRDRYRKRG